MMTTERKAEIIKEYERAQKRSSFPPRSFEDGW